MGRLRGRRSITARPDAILNEVHWAAIRQTYRARPEPFVKGAGQDTLARHVHAVTGMWIDQKDVRRALLLAIRDGKAMRRESALWGHTCFTIKNTRR